MTSKKFVVVLFAVILAAVVSACSGNDNIAGPSSSASSAAQEALGTASAGDPTTNTKVGVQFVVYDGCSQGLTASEAYVRVWSSQGTHNLVASPREEGAFRMLLESNTDWKWTSTVHGYDDVSGSFRTGEIEMSVKIRQTRLCGSGEVQPPPPPPPPSIPLICLPREVTTKAGTSVTFNAVGGSGKYVWSTTSASPAVGSGQTFTTGFFGPGTFQVKVASGDGEESICTVTVQDNPPPQSAPSCSLTVNPTSVEVGKMVVASIRVTSGVATAATMLYANFPLTNGAATTPSFIGGAYPQARTLEGSVTGPGGTGHCSAVLNVTPDCSPKFELRPQGSGVIPEANGVQVKAIFVARSYQNVTAIIHWQNGDQTKVKRAKSVSAGCNEVVDDLIFLSTGSESHMPRNGAVYTLMLVQGVVQEGPVPAGMQILAQHRIP